VFRPRASGSAACKGVKGFDAGLGPERRQSIQQRLQDMAISKAERKDWARVHFKGFENILMPSFTPDLSGLDEQGIRHDVRQSIAHGVFSVFAVPLAMSPQEAERFLQVVCDEAGGRIAVGLPVIAPNREAELGLLRTAETAGCTHALIHPWHEFRAETAEDLYRYYRELIDATELGVALWATDGHQFTHLHPSNVVVEVFDRLADLPNVVALKLMTTLDLAVMYELCERMHRKVLVGGVHLGTMPLLVKHYGMQWSGAWTIEALQSPERPYVVQYLEHLLEGRTEQALAAYWHIRPAYDALFALMAPMLPKGVHPFTHLKYYQWCVGGNGGLLREAQDPNEREFPLRGEDRRQIEQALRGIGIEPQAGDDSFVPGRAAAARGERAGATVPSYGYAA